MLNTHKTSIHFNKKNVEISEVKRRFLFSPLLFPSYSAAEYVYKQLKCCARKDSSIFTQKLHGD